MSQVKVNKVSPRSGTDITLDGKLITESNGDLNLYPNGTGAVEIGGNTNPGTIILNCESNSHGIKLQSPAHSAGQSYTLKFPTGNVTADKFLKVASVSGSGATGVGQLSFDDAGGGITEADQWRLTSQFQGDADPIASNLERVDTTGWGKLGTGMSQSSGIFTFPSTGIWLVKFDLHSYYNATNRYATAAIQITTNNSSYANISAGEQGITSSGSNIYGYVGVQSLIDCTDTSNVKVKFKVDCENNSTYIQGDTNVTYTSMTFIRLGDT